MKELNIGRMITISAAGSLFATGTLFATGCASSVEKTEDAPTEEEIKEHLGKFCERLQACDSEYFGAEYGSLGDCKEDFHDYFSEEYDLNDSSCARALIDALDCYVKKVDCDGYSYDECESELDAMYDACDDGEFYSDSSGPSPIDDGDSSGSGSSGKGDSVSEDPGTGMAGSKGQ